MKGWQGAFVALFVCSWAGNQFSPLLLMYREVDGYSTVEVNAFLGVYVLGLAPSLLLAGTLSDRFGRRPLMFAGSVTAVLTSAVLALGTLGPVPLYLGRLLAGITVGTAMAVGTSWLKELSQAPHDPQADVAAGARRASLAFALGSGLGALVAGGLAQWAPAPKLLPYLTHLLVAIPLLFCIARIPETSGTTQPAARGRLVTPVAAYRRFRLVVVVVAPWIFGTAALSYGYLPVLLRDAVQGYGVAFATVLTVVCLGVSAIVQPVAKRLDSSDSARGLLVGMATLAGSVALVGLTVTLGSPAFGVVAAAISGVGIGIALTCGLLEVQRIAGPEHLAGLTGLFYAFAYLGFVAPTAMAAITPPFTTGQLFLALLTLAGVSAVTLGVQSRRNLPHPTRALAEEFKG